MVGTGMFSGIFQILCTSALVKRFGAKRMYQVSICAYFPLWALFPIAVSMAYTDHYLWRVRLLACIGMMLMTAADVSFGKHSNSLSSHPIVH